MTFGPRSAVSAAVHWLCWFVLCIRCTLQLLLSITFGICCPSRSRHFSFPYLKNGAPPLRVFLPSILFDVVSCRWGFFFFQGGEGDGGEAEGGAAVGGASSRHSVHCKQIGASQRCRHSQYWFLLFLFNAHPPSQTPQSNQIDLSMNKGRRGVNESCLYSATSRIDFNYR